jgi:phosphoribosyl 1,2-cyclic phosphodiesterase
LKTTKTHPSLAAPTFWLSILSTLLARQSKSTTGDTALSALPSISRHLGIQRIYLFHHDPAYDDKKVFGILQSARWYLDHLSIKGIEVHLAMEGLEIRL